MMSPLSHLLLTTTRLKGKQKFKKNSSQRNHKIISRDMFIINKKLNIFRN